MTPEVLAALDQAKRDKRPVVLATRLPSGEQFLLFGRGDSGVEPSRLSTP